MGKFGNFELNEAQRKVLAEKNQRRNELRNLYWKNITDPHRHATGEGGHLVNRNSRIISLYENLFVHNLMIYILREVLCHQIKLIQFIFFIFFFVLFLL